MVSDCPRCASSYITFDVYADVFVGTSHGWVTNHEVIGTCRRCHRPSIFRCQLRAIEDTDKYRRDNSLRSYDGTLNDKLTIKGVVTQRDVASAQAPAYTPETIQQVFAEGTASVAGGCYNAAGAMFRLCLDIVTKGLLPTNADDATKQPNRQQREKLAYRLEWLFQENMLPLDLKELARCVREDGNDGAHDGTLDEVDAGDLQDFTNALLERIYTEPGKILAAQARREARRKPPQS
ncbi:DUF4145 domain-containing protein [Sphingomonas beigongshangi]|uniref:DUF4145 domain-containing protein n=1 Tax=Sphingomonas beigongshangi TaxID=2782540 RepID=UPI001EED1C23|nr:DUF4145 domain-containing protein [Sphingomonas beigongshangi]